MAEKITPRTEDYSRWYTDVVTQSRMADYSPVKGSMVIRPHGYAIWENMQQALDAMFKETGHKNAYFPLFIPKSFLAKEAAHVDGFAKECAIVTHSRLMTAEVNGKPTLIPDPESKLEEELIVRPTSETIIYSMFSKWIKSYRDLPLLINQWANVVRWEMRTRLFLRTTEFLWQEGHTAHSSQQEAEEETVRMLGVYAKFAEEWMAVPVIQGVKTESEKFAGADHTYCIEGLMQDNRALQAGTSHNLGQNFSTAFDVRYQDQDGKWQHAWNTSWGVSTRLVGAVVMAHGDDQGLILPPKLAPIQVVIVPILRGKEGSPGVPEAAEKLREELRAAGIRVELDNRPKMSPGFKFHEWELAGVPIRVELGPKDLENASCVMVSRIDRKKTSVSLVEAASVIPEMLTKFQSELLEAARERMAANTHIIGTWEDFVEVNDSKGGFLLAHWCGDGDCEKKIQEQTKATIRCLAFDQPDEEGVCVRCDGKSKKRAHFAKAY